MVSGERSRGWQLTAQKLSIMVGYQQLPHRTMAALPVTSRHRLVFSSQTPYAAASMAATRCLMASIASL
jgi:hypothetical protein